MIRHSSFLWLDFFRFVKDYNLKERSPVRVKKTKDVEEGKEEKRDDDEKKDDEKSWLMIVE